MPAIVRPTERITNPSTFPTQTVSLHRTTGDESTTTETLVLTDMFND